MASKPKPKIIKKVAGATWYEGHVLKLENVRASYPHLDKPYSGEDGGVPSFGVVALMDKKTQRPMALLVNEAIAALLKENQDAKVAKDKKCLRDGDDTD